METHTRDHTRTRPRPRKTEVFDENARYTYDDEDEKTYEDEKLQAGMAYEKIQIRP